MSGLEIVTEHSRGFDEHGHRTQSVRGFVKLDESVEPLLYRLRGAPLSFFICIAAHEPSVCQNGKAPYTRSDVERITGFSERAVQYAAQMLVSLNFAVVCGTTARGEKMYRPSGEYAWFGNERGAKVAPQEEKGAKVAPRKASTPGVQKPTGRGAKTDIPKPSSRSRGVQKPSHDDDVNSRPSQSSGKHHHNMAGVRQILQAGGFRGQRRDELARILTEDEAHKAAEWVVAAKNHPGQYPKPYGYVYALAISGSIADLPEISKTESISWCGPEYAKFVHGRPEHAQYCREHPDLVDCDCGEPSEEEVTAQ